MSHQRIGEFAEFVAGAWPRLVRTAHMLTGDFHEAEDLVQTTLAKVYGRWKHIPQDDVDVYVRRALVNNNVSRVRKRRVIHLLTPFLPEPMHQAHAGHVEAVEHRAAILQALSALPARQRTVIVLRYFEDLSDPEIAAALNCSLGTIKTHARRGLTALRAHPAFTEPPSSTIDAGQQRLDGSDDGADAACGASGSS
ncbi:SigE family RNA polymerase sigma factor [Streptomyces sp. NBC_00233]|uniref:SigE family RNA polymerase sigma factor n=1 Tax=Streptomyces sp. NBC_00233 TaxID=2975686 RepID=UPI00224E63BC|nr:SigE family RNA polymerase sigma factor [Streptomyces sp. NBC_00233]MCX5233394.1 SigE family RNA polymerase sigma factor [Streptomyces sp. NBC_00233]